MTAPFSFSKFIGINAMQIKPIQCFLYSTGIVLLVASLAKLISAAGSARILEVNDGIIPIPYRYLFIFVGSLELGVSLYCLFGKINGLKIGLVAWLSLSFLLYRVSLLWIGYHMPCTCLGSLTGMLHIASRTADFIMQIILAYLLAGSILSGIWILFPKVFKMRLKQPDSGKA